MLEPGDHLAVSALLDRVGGVRELSAAVDFYISQRPRERKTIKDVVDECVLAKKAAKRSVKYLKLINHTFNSFAAGREEMPIDLAATKDIEDWLANGRTPQGNPWSGETQKYYLKDIRSLFSYALKRGYCITNPALQVENRTVVTAPPGILTVDEVRTLMGRAMELDRKLIPTLALSLFGGLRTSEVEHLTWKQIRDGHIEIQAATTRTRRRRLVKINPTLEAWLKVEPKADLPAINFRSRLDKLRFDREPGNKHQRGKIIKTHFPWPKNCLRHSFVSYSYPIFGARETAIESGHSESILFKHYRHLVKKSDAELFWNTIPK